MQNCGTMMVGEPGVGAAPGSNVQGCVRGHSGICGTGSFALSTGGTRRVRACRWAPARAGRTDDRGLENGQMKWLSDGRWETSARGPGEWPLVTADANRIRWPRLGSVFPPPGCRVPQQAWGHKRQKGKANSCHLHGVAHKGKLGGFEYEHQEWPLERTGE